MLKLLYSTGPHQDLPNNSLKLRAPLWIKDLGKLALGHKERTWTVNRLKCIQRKKKFLEMNVEMTNSYFQKPQTKRKMQKFGNESIHIETQTKSNFPIQIPSLFLIIKVLIIFPQTQILHTDI